MNNSRFFLYKRKNSKNWYVQFKLNNGLYSSGKSVMTTDKSEAEYKVLRWLHDNVPFSKTTENTTPKHDLLINAAIENLRRTTLCQDDVSRILELFKKRGLFEGTHIPKKNKTTFINFLNQFWDYETSQYIQDKLSHGHKIGQRRCKEATAFSVHADPNHLALQKGGKLVACKLTALIRIEDFR